MIRKTLNRAFSERRNVTCYTDQYEYSGLIIEIDGDGVLLESTCRFITGKVLYSLDYDIISTVEIKYPNAEGEVHAS